MNDDPSFNISMMCELHKEIVLYPPKKKKIIGLYV